MTEGLAGDPMHEGSSKPMVHLKGGMEGPHTQMPMDSTAMDNPRSAAVDNIGQTWNTTSLGEHPAPTSSNDKNKAH